MENNQLKKYARSCYLANNDFEYNAQQILKLVNKILVLLFGSAEFNLPFDKQEVDLFLGYMGPGDIIEDRNKGEQYKLGTVSMGVNINKGVHYFLGSNGYIDKRGDYLEINSYGWIEAEKLSIILTNREISIYWLLRPAIHQAGLEMFTALALINSH